MTGEKLSDGISVSGYAYQAYWPDMKVDNNGRIHFCVMVLNKSNWSLASKKPKEGADINKEYTVTNSNGNETYV